MNQVLIILLISSCFLPQKKRSLPFQAGEQLVFSVRYGIITAGRAQLQIMPNTTILNGKPCYHIIGKGNSNKGFDLMYKVRDKYETYLDTADMVPVQFNRTISEGSFYSYTETHFDQEQRAAVYLDEKKRKTTYRVPANIQDIVSSLYYMRAKHQHDTLQIGTRLPLTNFLDRQTFRLEAVLEKKETIKVKGRKFEALKLRLNVDESGLLTDNGKIKVWISNDENKIPVLIECDLAIGKIKAELIHYKNLKYPIGS